MSAGSTIAATAASAANAAPLAAAASSNASAGPGLAVRDTPAFSRTPFPGPSASSRFSPAGGAWYGRRSAVLARHGAVACSQPLASDAGLTLLKAGANAAEAAIAVAACLCVLEPGSTGLGGDCFALHYNARTKEVQGLNGSGRAPRALSPSRLEAKDRRRSANSNEEFVHPLSVHAVTVPGAARGWEDTLKRWGSGRFTMAQLLEPAIRLAEEGVPISPLTAESWARCATLLRSQNSLPSKLSSGSASDSETGSSAAVCCYLPGGAPPAAGDLFRNPGLAATFRVLAGPGGADEFYSGRIGQSIVEALRVRGGCMDLEDLTSHTSTSQDPISVEYKGVRVWEMPPNGQGITALLALQMLKQLEEKAEQAQKEQQQQQQQQKQIDGTTASSAARAQATLPASGVAAAVSSSPASPPVPPPSPCSLRSLGHNSAAYLHRLIEILRLAFADTRYFVCDTNHPDADRPLPLATEATTKEEGSCSGVTARKSLHALLDPSYASRRISLLDPSQATLNHPHGSPVHSSNTVSFVLVDGEGNACSFIQSIYMQFGSGIEVPQAGFVLQNRGANFCVDPEHPNRVQGGKRPYHTIIPGLVTDDRSGELWGPFSVMGAFMQPQGHVQLLLNILEFGMDPQMALDAPRICIESGEAGGEVLVEEGIDEAVARELQAKGHLIRIVKGYDRVVFGRGQIIIRRTVPKTADGKDAVLWAGSDGRGDGCAVGF